MSTHVVTELNAKPGRRVFRLADDLPEVAERDLNPVIARPDGAHIVAARSGLPGRPP